MNSIRRQEKLNLLVTKSMTKAQIKEASAKIKQKGPMKYVFPKSARIDAVIGDLHGNRKPQSSTQDGAGY